MPKPGGAGSVAQRQRLGQAAGLVELDVDHVVAAGERGKARRGRGSSRRRRPAAAAACRPAPRRRRRAAAARPWRRRARERRRQRGVGLGGPALVGVDDDARVRRAGAHRLDAREVARPPELDLEERPGGVLGRLRPHRLGGVERQRVGGDLRPGLGEAGELPDAAAALLRLEVPERAVDGVARGPRRQQRLEGCAVEGGGERRDLGGRRCRGSRRSGRRARTRRARRGRRPRR